jgi:hypothetical protein
LPAPYAQLFQDGCCPLTPYVQSFQDGSLLRLEPNVRQEPCAHLGQHATYFGDLGEQSAVVALSAVALNVVALSAVVALNATARSRVTPVRSMAYCDPGPTPGPEQRGIAITPPSSAIAFHISKCNSLPPPEHQNLCTNFPSQKTTRVPLRNEGLDCLFN